MVLKYIFMKGIIYFYVINEHIHFIIIEYVLLLHLDGKMFVQTKKGMDLSPDYTQTSFNECHRMRYFNENQC